MKNVLYKCITIIINVVVIIKNKLPACSQFKPVSARRVILTARNACGLLGMIAVLLWYRIYTFYSMV